MARKPEIIPDNASARRFLTTSFKNIWLEQRAGSYVTAHRGPLNWAAFDFEKSPRAVAILLDETSLFRNKRGFLESALTFELFARLNDNPTEIDDGLMDEMYEDILQVLLKATNTVTDAGLPLIGRIVKDGARAVETHDATRSVQGLVAMMRIEF